MAESALDTHIMEFLNKRLDALAYIHPDKIPDTMQTLVKEMTRTIDANERIRAMPFWAQLEPRDTLQQPHVFWTEHLYHAMLLIPIAQITALYRSESIPEDMHVRRVAYLYVTRALGKFTHTP